MPKVNSAYHLAGADSNRTYLMLLKERSLGRLMISLMLSDRPDMHQSEEDLL